MDWREREKRDNAAMKKDAYVDENGVWRWKNNNHVPFEDMLACWDLDPWTMKKCIAAREKDVSETCAAYRERMKNYVPSDEEMYEMRCAFGTGASVVNVLTGNTIIL